MKNKICLDPWDLGFLEQVVHQWPNCPQLKHSKSGAAAWVCLARLPWWCTVTTVYLHLSRLILLSEQNKALHRKQPGERCYSTCCMLLTSKFSPLSQPPNRNPGVAGKVAPTHLCHPQSTQRLLKLSCRSRWTNSWHKGRRPTLLMPNQGPFLWAGKRDMCTCCSPPGRHQAGERRKYLTDKGTPNSSPPTQWILRGVSCKQAQRKEVQVEEELEHAVAVGSAEFVYWWLVRWLAALGSWAAFDLVLQWGLKAVSYQLDLSPVNYSVMSLKTQKWPWPGCG